jgi:Grx4 family monothiol glutaredoxin
MSAGAALVVEIASDAELKTFCGNRGSLCAVLLWAPWHPPSVHLTKVLEAIAAGEKGVGFAKVNTDICPSLATSLGADQVPFVAFLDPLGNRIDKLGGADPPKLVERVKALAAQPLAAALAAAAPAAAGESDLNTRLKQLIEFSHVMLFMKGSKAEPFCKFSKQAIAILNNSKAEYSTFDILKDDEVREGLKTYSNWKTYPQLYIDGELLGGIDIIKEMEEEGTLQEALGNATGGEEEETGKSLEERLKALINKEPVMCFIKGTPDEPHCGFSGKLIEVMKQNSVSHGYFNILSDEEIRQGLKAYSNWPTYPQVYAQGKLVGGIDIIKELAEEGALLDELGVNTGA